jgi:hypothetical protein
MKEQESKLRVLMVSLYYPAILGSWIFLFVNKLSDFTNILDALADLTNYQGLFLLIYFSSMYLEVYFVNPSSYRICSFFLDITETVLLYLAFFYIGYLHPKYYDLQKFYFFLMFVPIFVNVWNVTTHLSELSLWILGLISSGILALGASWGWEHSWFNWGAVILFTGFLLLYLCVLND